MANIARLGVVLALESGDFVMGMEAAKKSISDFGSKIAGALPMAAAAAGAAFVGMAKHALDFADNISDVADATNMSIASVLKVGDALEMSGGKFEDAGKVLEKFNQNISAAAMGSQPLQDAFKKIGISLKDLASPDTEKIFEKAVDGLAKIGDVATATNVKVQLFGKGMRNVDMQNFNDLIKEGNGAWEKYADAVATAAELHDKLSAKATRTTLMFTQAFLPAMNTTFDAMNKAGSAMETFAEVASMAFKTAIYAGNIFVTVLQTINASVNLVGLLIDDMAHGKFDTLMSRLKEYDEYVGAIRKKDKQFAYDLLHPPEVKGKKPNEGRTTELSSEAKKLEEMLNVTKLISVEYQRQVNFLEGQQHVQFAIQGMAKDEATVYQAISKAMDETSKKIDEITKKREDAAGRGADKKVLAEYDNQIEKVKAIGAAFAENTRLVAEMNVEVQRTFLYGWNKAFKQYAEDAENYGRLAENMFSSFTGHMNDAIDKFVENGKISFSDLANSIIKDLLKIQLRMAMSQGISSMFGASGLGGIFNSFVRSSNEASPGFVGPPSSAMGAAASGGQIDSPTLVGENGPEIFIPNRSGTVVPNNMLSDVMGGGGGVTYNGTVIQNMQAIDTQSALQFLAKNKMGVYSANQSAARSIPTSR
jgi:lambda family phage tail tape measure protein